MHPNEWFAVRAMLDRHRRWVGEADDARNVRGHRADRTAPRRRLAAALATLARRLDPERGSASPTGASG